MPPDLAYPAESSDRLVLPVVPGRDREAFGGGRENDPLQPPIIDILVPPGDTQERILRDYSSEQERPAQIPGRCRRSCSRPPTIAQRP